MSGHGLVLGGGGITGIAWELGLITGLAELGLDVRSADVVIGTSAGSIVGAQLSSGMDLEELYATQLVEPDSSLPRAALDKRVMLRYGVALVRSRGNLTDFGRRLGALTIRAGEHGQLPTLRSRYDAIGAALPSTAWPDTDLRVTAVDARTGAFRVFGRDDGVPLLRAVAASCAVPGVYPAVPVDGRLYIDGGARSFANADVARGCERVLAITPMARAPVDCPRRAANSRVWGSRPRSSRRTPTPSQRSARTSWTTPPGPPRGVPDGRRRRPSSTGSQPSGTNG